MFYQKISYLKNREILEKNLPRGGRYGNIFRKIFFFKNSIDNCSKYMYIKFEVNRTYITGVVSNRPSGGDIGKDPINGTTIPGKVRRSLNLCDEIMKSKFFVRSTRKTL